MSGVSVSEAASRVLVGPFAAGPQPFVIESNEPEIVSAVTDRLRDLRTEVVSREPTVFRVDREGPSWHSHPWGVWRDGEPCETSLTHGYVLPYLLWEVTRLLLDGVTTQIPIHAACVARDRRAVVLAGGTHAGKSTLAAWLTSRGWGFLTDEVAILDVHEDIPVIEPFWRPIGVRLGGPLDALITSAGDDPEALVPASQLGALAERARLAAIVLPQYSPGACGTLDPLAPAPALSALAQHLPKLREQGRRSFQQLTSVVQSVPAFSLRVDDLDGAERVLAELMERVR